MPNFDRLDPLSQAKVARSQLGIAKIWALDSADDALDADLRTNSDSKNWTVTLLEFLESFAKEANNIGINRNQAQHILRRHRDKRFKDMEEQQEPFTKRNKKLVNEDMHGALKELKTEVQNGTLDTYLQTVIVDRAQKDTRRRTRSSKKSLPQPNANQALSQASQNATLIEDHVNNDEPGTEPPSVGEPQRPRRGEKKRRRVEENDEDQDEDSLYAGPKSLQGHIDLAGRTSITTRSAKRLRQDLHSSNNNGSETVAHESHANNDSDSAITTVEAEESQELPALVAQQHTSLDNASPVPTEMAEEQQDETEMPTQNAVHEPSPDHVSVAASGMERVSLQRQAGSPQPTANPGLDKWNDSVGDGKAAFARQIETELMTAGGQRGTLEAELSSAHSAWLEALVGGNKQENVNTSRRYNELVVEKSRVMATITALQNQLKEIKDE
ncbi:hypothetical protein BDV96DRAFT_644484 [Lophiotrema nucula]|uniref:Uncharacterized protein n=1 Tax=Lophiotrema nucula TaxID=690887 RepID=A0A6A5ZC06_9PLEO|nr:hypothetical protein BDV96DRAFT_644484 [Lophiotrema nucula]